MVYSRRKYKSYHVVMLWRLRTFEAGQTVPEICMSEMRQMITTALRTVFGEVRVIILLAIHNAELICCCSYRNFYVVVAVGFL